MKIMRILAAGSGATICCLFLTCAGGATAAERPNIILIFADDLGYGDVACFDENCTFETPVLDQMAKDGARLTNFYVPTPYCAPSRATILTGRYPFRHTMMSNPAPDAGLSNFGLPQSEITIAEALKTAGYATAAYGKWHLGHKKKWLPRTQGFDEYYGILYSNDMFPVQLIHNEKVVEYPVLQATLTKRYTERAIQFIEKHKNKPFFLYLPHAMPHKPLAASDDFYTPETRDNLYADVIKELDTSIGDILEKLKQLKIDDNTIVIFTSDNGPWYGGSSGGLRGMKGTTWDGGLRVPMIVRWPGHIPGGIENHAPTATVDVFPTLCKIAGVPLPTDRVIDGKDIWPVLTQGAPTPHEAFFYHKTTKLEAVRSGNWKLHVQEGKPTALYNLETDIGESNNVLADHKAVEERLLNYIKTFEADLAQNSRPAGYVDNAVPLSK